MIRQLITLLAGALWLSSCSAPDPYAGHEWPDASPALWQATAPDGHTAYLFGTIHALPEGIEWRSEIVDASFAEAGLLVVEIANLADGSAASTQFERRAYSPGLPPLIERLPARDRTVVASLLEKAEANASDFDGMESWAAAMMLSGALRSGDPANGVDRALLAESLAGGKPATGLESFAAQYAVFDALPSAEQQDLLVAIAREAQGYDPIASIESWLSGDMARLEDQASNGLLADPELREALLDSRNKDWIAKIVPLVESGQRPFIAVGAAHMLGETGLPALLAAAGFTVERLQ